MCSISISCVSEQPVIILSTKKKNGTIKPIEYTMDVEKLHVVLQQSFSPDASLRGPAEETIRNLKHVNGATIMLLQVAAEKQVSVRATKVFAMR
jgi:hypothetical protein